MDVKRLLERVKTGDNDALKIIYETYSPMMRGVCKGITKEDEDTVSDLVQEAFVLAYNSVGKLKDPEKFGSWVVTIAKNVSLKHLETKRRRSAVSLSALAEGDYVVDDTLLADSILSEKEIMELVGKLPAGYGKVFELSVIEGYSHKEIAEKLGIEPHSSSSQLSRAKAMLRKMISKRTLIGTAVALTCAALLKMWLQTGKVVEPEATNATVARVGDGNAKAKESQGGNGGLRQNAAHGEPNAKLASASAVSSDVLRRGVLADTVVAREDSMGWARERLAVAGRNDSVPQPDSGKVAVPKADVTYVAEAVTSNSKGRKWQLLAAGSLGPALAQSAYRLIVGKEPDFDASTSIDPVVNKTWEEYNKYLVKNSQDTPADTALIAIANNNSGKIVEHEHHSKPVTIGFALTKALGTKWLFETGLQYSLLKSDFELGEKPYYVNTAQSVHYLGVPLKVSYKLFGLKGWTLYSSAGVTMNIPLSGKTKETYVVGASVLQGQKGHFAPAFQWTLGAGVGLQYEFAPKWGLYVEPMASWYVPNGSSVRTVWTEHPFTVTIPFGIRYTW